MEGFKAGQVVMITGASSGIGAATARRFAKAGGRVILLARRGDRIAALAREIGNGAEAHALDVRDPAAVESVLAALPVPDVLVNNAGLSRGVEKTDEVALDNFDAVVDTNVKGLFYVTRQVLKGMRPRGTGHVVNIGSVGWMCPFPGGNHYAASKAAVHALTQAFRSDTMGTRIRVSEVLPGMVETEFSEVRFAGDRDRAAAAYKGMRPLTGDDIADAVFYCVGVPPHVNVEMLVIFPQQQVLGPAVVTRDS